MRLLAVATVTASLLAAAPGSAATIQTYKVANWDLGAYTNNNTGRFSHCAASGRYRNGLTLIFSVTESLDWGISFLNPEWNIREGRVLDIDFRIDGGRVNTASARAVSSRQIVAKLPDSADLFNQFRYGSRLVVSINDGKPVPFNLSDTNAMLTEVLRCANRHKGYVDRSGTRLGENERDNSLRDNNLRDNNLRDNRVTHMPDGNDESVRAGRQPAQTPSSTPALAPTPESRAEATEMATNILRRANFDFEIQKPDQLTPNLRDKYDVVWRADGMLGTLRILSGSRETTVDKIRGELIASDAGTCKGKFASGAVPGMTGSQSQTIYTSCEGQANWSIYYIAVPRRKGGIYLLGIAGTGDVAARVQNVASAYRTVALEVLER